MSLELFLWLVGFALTVVFGVGAIVFWINTLTNKRIDDLKELFKAILKPLQNQVENHIPSQIKELREKEDRDFKELKANQEGLLTNQEGLQANQEKLQVSQEGLRTNQEKLQVNQEGLRANQEKLQVSQEGLQANQEKLQVSQEQIQKNLGKVITLLERGR